MGYDISAKFNTKAERDAMFEFIEQEKDLIEMIFKLDRHTAFNLTNRVVKGENLGVYAPKKHLPTLIGMHGTGIPYSNWALCAWLNVKANCLKKGKNFIFYDDEVETVEIVKPGNLEGLNTVHFVVRPNGVAIARLQEAEGLGGKAIEVLTGLNKEKFTIHQKIAEYLEVLDEKYQAHLELKSRASAKSKELSKEKSKKTNKPKK